MIKTEYAWVIQRDDGKYIINWTDFGEITQVSDRFLDFIEMFLNEFSVDFKYLYRDDTWCRNVIKFYNLQNCKPVKVEIRVVGE